VKNTNRKHIFSIIYNLVRKVPKGFVSTYGDIAKISSVCHARTVGYAMAATPDNSDIPWQRVINSKGEISPRKDGFGNLIQRKILEDEGIEFDTKGRIDLNRYRWDQF
jgi:methylated-DNA-protein-cysteine methyltransferase-like protein